jgi:hypothetical protein
MPEFRTAPEALAEAAREVAADGRLVQQAAGSLRTSVRGVADALPGSGTATEVERLAGALAADAAALAAELAAIGAALAVAARDYVAVEAAATGEFRRAGRWSA